MRVCVCVVWFGLSILSGYSCQFGELFCCKTHYLKELASSKPTPNYTMQRINSLYYMNTCGLTLTPAMFIVKVSRTKRLTREVSRSCLASCKINQAKIDSMGSTLGRERLNDLLPKKIQKEHLCRFVSVIVLPLCVKTALRSLRSLKTPYPYFEQKRLENRRLENTNKA